MRAITVRDEAAGVDGMRLTNEPLPRAAENDVVVRVHAAGFTPGELTWPGTWTDRAGRDRTPSIPGHELSGVVTELGYGTTGLTIGQRVFGLADWSRNGSLAEYSAVEARNLAPLSSDIDHTIGAALPISGLTAWQGRMLAPPTRGSLAVQLARAAGAQVIGTGRAGHEGAASEIGVDRFIDLEHERLEDAGEVDLVFDVLGGEIRDRSTALVRAGGTLVTIAGPPTIHPTDGRAIFFVVEADRIRLADLARRVRAGEISPRIGAIRELSEAPSAFARPDRSLGRTIIRV